MLYIYICCCTPPSWCFFLIPFFTSAPGIPGWRRPSAASKTRSRARFAKPWRCCATMKMWKRWTPVTQRSAFLGICLFVNGNRDHPGWSTIQKQVLHICLTCFVAKIGFGDEKNNQTGILGGLLLINDWFKRKMKRRNHGLTSANSSQHRPPKKVSYHILPLWGLCGVNHCHHQMGVCGFSGCSGCNRTARGKNMLFDGKGARMERERRRETYLKILFPDPCFLRFLVLKLAFVDFGRACFASEDELLRQERLGESGEETWHPKGSTGRGKGLWKWVHTWLILIWGMLSTPLGPTHLWWPRLTFYHSHLGTMISNS